MTFETLVPLRLKTKTLGVISLKTGQQVTLPDEAVRQLIKKVPQKIKVLKEKPTLQPGIWCEWLSPLFGKCTGQVVAIAVKGYILTNHSILGPYDQVKIPVDWICGVYAPSQIPN